MLIKGLPRDALVRTPVSERGRDPWTAELELMAQLVEMTSVLAANHRIKKPVKVPRPKKDKTAPGADRRTVRPVAVGLDGNPYRAAIQAFGGTRPSRLRAADDAGPAARTEPASAPPDPAYRAAIRAFGASQPARLRLVDDGGRDRT